jgi:glucose-6-phosphate-specific signal transduction histidine kinase
MEKLEREFRLRMENHFLEQNISAASQLLNHYWINFLNLVERYNKLEQSYQNLLADNEKLTSQLIEMYEQIEKKKAVSIPEFLKCHQH